MIINAFAFSDDVIFRTGAVFTMGGAITTSNDDISIYADRANISQNIFASGGDILVSAVALTNGRGIQFTSGADVITSGTGTIALVGNTQNTSSADTNGFGISFSQNSIIETDSGDITITGTGSKTASNSRGIVVQNSGVEIRSASGAINITEVNPVVTTGVYNGMYLFNGVQIGKGNLASSSSDVTIESDKITLSGTIDTTGSLTVQSNTNSFASIFDTSI